MLLHIIVKYFPKTNQCSKIDLWKELVLVQLSREVNTSKFFTIERNLVYWIFIKLMLHRLLTVITKKNDWTKIDFNRYILSHLFDKRQLPKKHDSNAFIEDSIFQNCQWVFPKGLLVEYQKAHQNCLGLAIKVFSRYITLYYPDI